MLAMLRKDLYAMGRYTAYLIFSWLVVTWVTIRFLESDAGFLYSMLPVFSLTISLNSVSADEGRWDRFAAVTPLRPWQIVLTKYLFAYGCLAVMTALAALAGGAGVKLWTVAAITRWSSLWRCRCCTVSDGSGAAQSSCSSGASRRLRSWVRLISGTISSSLPLAG